MIPQNARFFICACVLSLTAMAQTGPAPSPSASAPLQDKIAIVSIQGAIVTTNDGQRDLKALETKFEPKKTQLKSLSDEIDTLKKQLETQGPALNDEARASLSRQIDSKQKTLSRSQEDAQNDFTEQQNQIVQKILQKLVPIIDKYAKDNALALVMDDSKPWPDSPLLWANPSVDITKAVVDIYNAKSPASTLSPAPQKPPSTQQRSQPPK